LPIQHLITSGDSFGMYVKLLRTPRASDQPQQFKIRLPFPRKIEERKYVKDVIVESTHAASAEVGGYSCRGKVRSLRDEVNWFLS